MYMIFTTEGPFHVAIESWSEWYLNLRYVRFQQGISLSIYIYSDTMKTIQCAHLPHHRNNLVATYRLWTASGEVYELFVLEPTEWSTSTRLGA